MIKWPYGQHLGFSAQVMCLKGSKIESLQLSPGNRLVSERKRRAIARVHPVHLMNVQRRQAAGDPRPSQMT